MNRLELSLQFMINYKQRAVSLVVYCTVGAFILACYNPAWLIWLLGIIAVLLALSFPIQWMMSVINFFPWTIHLNKAFQDYFRTRLQKHLSLVSPNTVSLDNYAEFLLRFIRKHEDKISSLYLAMEPRPEQLIELRVQTVLREINEMAARLQEKYNRKVVRRIHVCKDHEAKILQFGKSSVEAKNFLDSYKSLNSSIEWRCFEVMNFETLQEEKKRYLDLHPMPLLHDFAVINKKVLIGCDLETKRIVCFKFKKRDVVTCDYLALFERFDEFTQAGVLWTWHGLGLNPHIKKIDYSHNYNADEQSTHIIRRRSEN